MAALVPLFSAPTASASNADNPVPAYQYIHDPSMIREGNTWYLFSTGDPNGAVNDGDIQVRCPPTFVPGD